MFQHPSALPNASVIVAGPRQGLLGSSNAAARTVTLYVRNCADEPLSQLAVVYGFEAGQFIHVEAWSADMRARYQRLRGTSSLTSSAAIKQDVASVFAYWQTGSTQYWQSPIAPPSISRLSSFVPYFGMY